MNIQQFWSDILAQRADEIIEYFHVYAYVNWHCSGEHFTVEEFIRANCEYPGYWDGEIEKIVTTDDMIITATWVSTTFCPACTSTTREIYAFSRITSA